MESVEVPPVTPHKPTAKKLLSSEKIRCSVHKKEKVEFLCQDDKIRICGVCVPSHSGH